MPIKSWRTGWIFGCCLFIWISCNRTGNDNPRLEKALSLSGSNRQELEKVLHHFSPDFVNVSPKNHLQIMGRYVDVVS